MPEVSPDARSGALTAGIAIRPTWTPRYVGRPDDSSSSTVLVSTIRDPPLAVHHG